jgi:hypothetical protein
VVPIAAPVPGAAYNWCDLSASDFVQLFLLEKLPEYSFTGWQQPVKCYGRSAGLNVPDSPQDSGWRLASVPDVVRMPREYCKCPIDLFGQHQASKFMGQSHWPQRQHRLALPPIRPATCRANSENNHLLA